MKCPHDQEICNEQQKYKVKITLADNEGLIGSGTLSEPGEKDKLMVVCDKCREKTTLKKMMDKDQFGLIQDECVREKMACPDINKSFLSFEKLPFLN